MVEDGREDVGLTEEKEQSVLYEMKRQMGEMQLKIDWLIRCNEEKKVLDVGLGMGQTYGRFASWKANGL